MDDQKRIRQPQVPCPYCRGDVSKVVDVEPSRQFIDTTRRRRECLECGQRFTTIERIAPYHVADVTSTHARPH